jgi:hypothetical protein
LIRGNSKFASKVFYSLAHAGDTNPGPRRCIKKYRISILADAAGAAIRCFFNAVA